MKENLGSLEFNIEKEDIEKVDSLNKNYRFGSSLTWNILDKYDIFA